MPILCSLSLWKRETQSGKGVKEWRGLQRVCWCDCAQPVSLIGQMSCVHYKRGTWVRWEAVNPGIRCVGQQSARPQGGLSGWFTGGMEPMCHVDLVCETEEPVFVCYSHVCPVSLNSTASNMNFTSYRKLQHRQKHTRRGKKQRDYLTKTFTNKWKRLTLRTERGQGLNDKDVTDC